MEKISEKEVERIEKLAGLSFSEADKKAFIPQLNSVVTYIDKLNQLDTSDIQPTNHAVSINNVFRKDLLTDSLDRKLSLKNSPDQDSQYFRVPRIIE